MLRDYSHIKKKKSELAQESFKVHCKEEIIFISGKEITRVVGIKWQESHNYTAK